MNFFIDESLLQRRLLRHLFAKAEQLIRTVCVVRLIQVRVQECRDVLNQGHSRRHLLLLFVVLGAVVLAMNILILLRIYLSEPLHQVLIRGYLLQVDQHELDLD